jgi:hypothetical protein
MPHRIRKNDEPARSADEICRRLISTFQRDNQGRRPVFGKNEEFQSDPHWRDYVPFMSTFHGDTGAGVGASHQTGWTALVTKMIEELSLKHKTNDETAPQLAKPQLSQS